jgi:hypothetical protein
MTKKELRVMVRKRVKKGDILGDDEGDGPTNGDNHPSQRRLWYTRPNLLPVRIMESESKGTRRETPTGVESS